MIHSRPMMNPLLLDPTRTGMLRKRAKSELRKALKAAFRAAREMLSGQVTVLPVLNVFCAGGKGTGKNPSCTKGGVQGSTAKKGGGSAVQSRLAKIDRLRRQKRILKSGQSKAGKARHYRNGAMKGGSVYKPAKVGALDTVANAFNPMSVFGSIRTVIRDLLSRLLPPLDWWKRLIRLSYLKGWFSTGKVNPSPGQVLQPSDPPAMQKTVEELGRRAHDDASNVADDIATKAGRAVDDAQRRNDPKGLDKALGDVLKQGMDRAEMVVDDAVVRSHAEGQLDGYEADNVESVTAKVEWTTREGACQNCSSHRGKVFTVKEARGLIPLHPRCRCAWSRVS